MIREKLKNHVWTADSLRRIELIFQIPQAGRWSCYATRRQQITSQMHFHHLFYSFFWSALPVIRMMVRRREREVNEKSPVINSVIMNPDDNLKSESRGHPEFLAGLGFQFNSFTNTNWVLLKRISHFFNCKESSIKNVIIRIIRRLVLKTHQSNEIAIVW